MRNLTIQTQSGTAEILEDGGIKLQTLWVILRHIFLRQGEVEVSELNLVAINIFALLMLADQLAIGQDDALIPIFETVTVECEKRDLGPIKPFLFFTSQSLHRCTGLLLLLCLPSSDLAVEGLQIFERRVGSGRMLLNLLELRQYHNCLGRFGAQPVFALTHNLILRNGLLVLVQPFIGAPTGKSED